MVVDAHHHFWRYSPAEYGWIDDRMAAIRRDFLPADLQREMRAAGVDAVVSVQARQSVEETRWLLDLAAQNPFIAGRGGLGAPGFALGGGDARAVRGASQAGRDPPRAAGRA
jgi:predicted TIM-barrel fold metal-dependent hydrolase